MKALRWLAVLIVLPAAWIAHERAWRKVRREVGPQGLRETGGL